MTLFFDRNIGAHIPRALRLLGLDVQWHQRRFGMTLIPDDQWLREVGLSGWIVVTHDTHFLHNQSERRAFIDHEVGCFLLSGGQVDRWSKVRILAGAWDRIEELAARQQRPFIWQVFPKGRVSRLYPPPPPSAGRRPKRPRPGP